MVCESLGAQTNAYSAAHIPGTAVYDHVFESPLNELIINQSIRLHMSCNMIFRIKTNIVLTKNIILHTTCNLILRFVESSDHGLSKKWSYTTVSGICVEL